MKRIVVVMLAVMLLLSTPALAISDKAHTLVSEMQSGKYVHEGGWPEHFLSEGWSEAEYLSALSEATEYAYAGGAISETEYHMYHGYLANNDLGDHAAPAWLMSALALAAAAGILYFHKKRTAA